MNDSRRFYKTACSSTDFQPAAGIIISEQNGVRVTFLWR